jgi:hypothetical protein
MKMKKTFDCVEMKHRGAERIYKQIVNMTPEEQLAFWQERTELLRKRQQTVKMRGKKSAN